MEPAEGAPKRGGRQSGSTGCVNTLPSLTGNPVNERAPDHIAKGNRTTSRGRRANAATATLAELGETIEGARIRAITGHEIDTIDEVLKCYAATTADQAAAALNIRMAYELKDASA